MSYLRVQKIIAQVPPRLGKMPTVRVHEVLGDIRLSDVHGSSIPRLNSAHPKGNRLLLPPRTMRCARVMTAHVRTGLPQLVASP
jgi:hypothetical protein